MEEEKNNTEQRKETKQNPEMKTAEEVINCEKPEKTKDEATDNMEPEKMEKVETENKASERKFGQEPEPTQKAEPENQEPDTMEKTETAEQGITENLAEQVKPEDSEKVSESANTQNPDKPLPDTPEILALLHNIEQKVDVLEGTFREKLMRSAQEEKILDSMHGELQKYRADLYASLLRPVLSELCGIRDSILRNKAFYEEKAKADEEAEVMVPLKLLAGYADELKDLLEGNDILIYRTKEGGAFNPAKHRVIKKVATAQEELHGKIAESQSAGYLYCGKTLSPEKVSVYYFEKPPENEDKAEGGEK